MNIFLPPLFQVWDDGIKEQQIWDSNSSGPCDLAPKETKMFNSFSSPVTVQLFVFQVPKALYKLMDSACWGPRFSITC
jgi:hypothetical protein